MLEFDPGVLRQLRRARKMKQEDVAAALCLSPACISKHENEQARVLAEDLARYAELYDVNVDVFYKESLK